MRLAVSVALRVSRTAQNVVDGLGWQFVGRRLCTGTSKNYWEQERALTLLVQWHGGQPACKKRWALVCWWWRCDWSFARLTALVVTTISIIISSNKIQNGDALVPANPRSTWKMTVQTEREFGNKNTDYAFPRRRLTLNTVYCARFYIDS